MCPVWWHAREGRHTHALTSHSPAESLLCSWRRPPTARTAHRRWFWTLSSVTPCCPRPEISHRRFCGTSYKLGLTLNSRCLWATTTTTTSLVAGVHNISLAANNDCLKKKQQQINSSTFDCLRDRLLQFVVLAMVIMWTFFVWLSMSGQTNVDETSVNLSKVCLVSVADTVGCFHLFHASNFSYGLPHVWSCLCICCLRVYMCVYVCVPHRQSLGGYPGARDLSTEVGRVLAR